MDPIKSTKRIWRRRCKIRAKENGKYPKGKRLISHTMLNQFSMNKLLIISFLLVSSSVTLIAQEKEQKNKYDRDYCADLSSGNIDLTLQYFKEVVNKDTSDLEALYTLGMCYWVKQQTDSAIIIYNSLIEKDFCYDYALINRAIANYVSGNKEEACMDYKAAMKCGYKITSTMRKEYKKMCKK